jgi:hypothetical protein
LKTRSPDASALTCRHTSMHPDGGGDW